MILGEQEKLTTKTIDDLIATIDSDEKEIENIKNSSEYTEFLQINEKLDSLSSEKIKLGMRSNYVLLRFQDH